MTKVRAFMSLLVLIVVIATLIVLPACSFNNSDDAAKENSDAATEPESEENASEPKNYEEWPETKTDIMTMEGMEEEIELQRFLHPDDLFLTYYPEDMITEEITWNHGSVQAFYSNFQGEVNKDAFVKFYIFDNDKEPASQGELNLQEFSSEMDYELEKSDSEIKEELLEKHPWAMDAGIYYDNNISGNVFSGEQSGTYFLVVIQYPHEFGDGMEPRIKMILDHYYWIDTEESLTEVN
ncbi:hypothetical protein [Natranaerobius thermophilus]|uniref:Lipoprotein n=1 Tax=Natranaerobius thermophilus (strain ATCC BAA-1301 / DSM 18059 / JW/NM-WN-LF) TaxID=457570 RepID=B2A2Q0_NATTJ|nr:hypothetical protein [Natranaerobius thermophilus]ACB86268.1 conserved hypothetical protein [Natranaerobius thermophilus JW/NM-WN-LF]